MLHSETYSSLFTFLTIVLICITVGMLFIYSSSSVYALERLGTADYYLKKQMFGLTLGFIGLIIVRLLPLSFIKKMVPWVFIGTLLLTMLTFIPGIGQFIHGSQ